MNKNFELEIEELIKGYLAYINKCDISNIELINHDVDVEIKRFLFIEGEYNVKN